MCSSSLTVMKSHWQGNLYVQQLNTFGEKRRLSGGVYTFFPPPTAVISCDGVAGDAGTILLKDSAGHNCKPDVSDSFFKTRYYTVMQKTQANVGSH